MKKSEIYNGFSEINEKYLWESENFEEIAMEFRRVKIHRAGKIVSLAACLITAVIVSINIHSKNDMTDRSSMLKPSVADENNSVIPETYKITENEQNTLILTSETDTDTETNENTETKLISAENNTSEKQKQYFSEVYKTTDTQTGYVTEISKEPAVISGTVSEKPDFTVRFTTVKPDVSTVKTSAAAAEKTSDVTSAVSTEKTSAAALTSSTEQSEYNDIGPHGVGNTTAKPNADPALSADENTEHDSSYCFFDGGCYKTLNRTVDAGFIDEYLGIIDMYRYDADTGTNFQRKARAYKIRGKSEYEMIAVLFDNETKFFAYGQS